MVRLGGRNAPNRLVRPKNQTWYFDRQRFRSGGDRRQRLVARIISKLPDLPLKPNNISDMLESFTEDIFDAVEEKVPPQPRRTHQLGGCETAGTAAAFTIQWDAREDARRLLRANPGDKPM